MYETILSPVEIGGLTLKNRIVFAPTSLGLKGEELEQKITAIAHQKDYGRGTPSSAESADRQIYYTAVLSEGIGHYVILRESGCPGKAGRVRYDPDTWGSYVRQFFLRYL